MTMNNPLKEMIADQVERKHGLGIPIPKYTFVVLVTGNSRQEIASAISRVDTDLAIDWADRDQIDSMGGNTSVVMEHTSPEQTPEKYADELAEWMRISHSSSGGIS